MARRKHRRVNVFHAVRPGTFAEMRHELSGGESDRLPSNHPAAKYRGAFTDNSLADKVAESLSVPARV